jgi:hypothetical protein
MQRKKVIYFTIVALDRTDNGGGLVCRLHTQRIAETENVDLVICTAGPSGRHEQEKLFTDSIGARYVPIDFLNAPQQRPSRWPFLYETEARNQRHVDNEFSVILDSERPDVLVVDYLFSAAFIASAYRRRRLRRVTITQNREVAFYRDLRRLRVVPPDCSSSPIAELRLFLFEQFVYARSHVVALSPEDLPFPRPKLSRIVIAPVLDQKGQRWVGEDSVEILFVGNIGHYPNRLAVEWIVDHLSPALESISSPAVINIIGASADQLTSSRPLSNVRFHGTTPDMKVSDHFRNCGLFVAPIQNNSGSKIKLADCLALGTPFAATKGALSGLPFLAGIPTLDLEDPLAAATLVTALLLDPEKRRSISRYITDQVATQLVLQKAAWKAALDS